MNTQYGRVFRIEKKNHHVFSDVIDMRQIEPGSGRPMDALAHSKDAGFPAIRKTGVGNADFD